MIDWIEDASTGVPATCPVCAVCAAQVPVLVVDNLFVPSDRLRFSRCSSCDSVWVREGALFEYTDHNAITADHSRHYLHVGAGIDFMVRPLERVRSDGSQSLLDVGCGYGFTLDYWTATAGGSAVGVEPSGYGRMGRDQLRANIYDRYLAEVAELRGRRFDIVYSSEVIEHVPDPVAFLGELRQHLSANGVLVLTTPSAEYVNKGANMSVMLAVLSPGLHKLLFSAHALEALLERVGFEHVQVEVHGERLVAFAADHPLTVGKGEAAHARYIEYLTTRSLHDGLVPDLRVGLTFRAFKELVNAGRAAEATRYRDLYATVVAESIGLDALCGRAAVEASRGGDAFLKYAAKLPYCHGVFLFYLAMHARHSGGDLRAAAEMFEAAGRVITASVQLAPEFFQEAATLVWLARFEYGSALLAAGERQLAIRCFDEVINGGVSRTAVEVAPPDELLRLRALRERGIAHLQLKRYEEARADFFSVMQSPVAPGQLSREVKKLEAQAGMTTREPQGPRSVLEWVGTISVVARCPVCEDEARKKVIVRAKSLAQFVDQGKTSEFVSCGLCGTVFPWPQILPSYDDDYGVEGFGRLYCEVWAGIEFMTRPLMAVHRVRPISTFVDVGCGYGFTVDFARRMFGATALGLDPSAYGREGAAQLGVEILSRYLDEAPLPNALKADMLLCSEVIEHVENPLGFAKILRAHLTDRGVLAITTPNSSIVAPDRAEFLVQEALFPGFHRQVFSKDGLATLLRRAGFSHVVVNDEEHRLMAFAANDPCVERIAVVPSPTEYRAYLQSICQDHQDSAGPVYSGALYRLLVDYVAHGKLSAAQEIRQQMQAFLADRYPSVSMEQPGQMLHLLSAARSIKDIAEVMPFWLPYALYQCGILALNGGGKAKDARELFAAAKHLIQESFRLGVRADPTIFSESALHEGIAAIVAGEQRDAIGLLSVTLSDDDKADFLRSLTPCVKARCLLQRGIARLQIGEPESGCADLRDALQDESLLPEGEVVIARALLDEYCVVPTRRRLAIA